MKTYTVANAPARSPGRAPAAGTLAALMIGLAVLAQPVRAEFVPEPAAGSWKTLVLTSGSQFRPSAPPTAEVRVSEGELGEVIKRQTHVEKDGWDERVLFWDNQGDATGPWSDILLGQGTDTNGTTGKIGQKRLNPVRASRAIALLNAAMYDATVAAWDAKYAYNLASPEQASPSVRPFVYAPPIPSFPSEHAAIASAAAAVLSYLFPEDAAYFAAQAAEAGESRIWAGTNFPSDVEAGRTLGELVGAAVVERAKHDGANAVYPARTYPTGPCLWIPVAAPAEPNAGYWRPWVLHSGADVVAVPPLACGSPEYQAEIDEVRWVKDHLTPEQKAIADFWAFPTGTFTPLGYWDKQAANSVHETMRYNTPRAARALALVGVSLADSIIACWDTKYDVYSRERPWMAIPGFVPYLPKPGHPSYTSGHATSSAAAAELLAYLFPPKAAQYRGEADEAALSRLYGGIHFRSDNENGLAQGREVARIIIDYAIHDGSN